MLLNTAAMSMTTLLLLPGMDGTGALFESFVAHLGGDLDVRVVSYPGNEPLGYSELEPIARAALPDEGPVVVLGESFSGPIAVSLAASCPSRVVGLVLCCSFVRNPRPSLSALRSFVAVLPVALAPMRVLSRLLLGRSSTAALRTALADALAKVSPKTLRARMQAVLSIDVSAELQAVTVPVLYLRASRDRVVPRAASELVLRTYPDADVATLDAPHLILQAAPAEAARVVSAFVRDLENVP